MTEGSPADEWDGLAAPARRALLGAGYTKLDELTRVREAELLELHGMGPNAVRVLRERLAERGQGFAD